MEVYLDHSNITQNMHGASRNYRYVWDLSLPGSARAVVPWPSTAPTTGIPLDFAVVGTTLGLGCNAPSAVVPLHSSTVGQYRTYYRNPTGLSGSGHNTGPR